MLFNSISFLVFFPVVVLLYYIIPKKYRYIWLLVASYYFYMSWNAKYAFLLLFSTTATYLTAIGMDACRNNKKLDEKRIQLWKRIFVALCVTTNLLILFYFKYANFVIDNLNQILRIAHVELLDAVDVILPVGISFYTFQALGYIVDVYRDEVKVEKNFLRYALFISFFPQLVAGPIERSKNLLSQMRKEHKFSFTNVRDGLVIMIWGFFLKLVIADRAAIFVDAVYSDLTTYTGYYVIIASILFAFQIYCDFAGYSTIAMGAAKVMGFQLMDNFNAPYFSRSISEFWTRWHISLNSWFRDYLYIPLGGNRKGTIRKYINTMIVFLLSGLWHGAGMHFVVWGGINGLNQIIGKILMPVRDKLQQTLHLDRNSFSHKIFQMVFTFCLVDFAWIFFRASTLSDALLAVNSIFHADNPWILFDGSIYSVGGGLLMQKGYQLLWFSIVILLIADMFKYKGIRVRDVINKQELWFRWLFYVVSILAILVLGIYGYGFDEQNFIYFQF